MEQNSKRDGRIVLVCILSFFLTVMTVNAFFVYAALNTYTGVVDQSDGK